MYVYFLNAELRIYSSFYNCFIDVEQDLSSILCLHVCIENEFAKYVLSSNVDLSFELLVSLCRGLNCYLGGVG